ncbi:MAG: glycosyltransferase family 87 protein [Candidatus Limnocylindria bacterium]
MRLARIVALAVIIGIGFNHVYWSATDWHLEDMNAYWDAGMRLRMGEALYPPVNDVLASAVYRYSPWFAWVWAPLTVLPRGLVNVAWSLILLTASAAAVWPMARRRAWIGVAFFLPILIGISAGGNVHALLIAALVLGVERRSGPLWIGVAASLKLFPILFALTYIGRRQWWRAATTGTIGAILLAPYLLYDLSNYVTTAGGATLLLDWPVVYAAAVVAAIGTALWLAASRYAWLASAAAVVLALPRSFLYDITWIMVGTPATASDRTNDPFTRGDRAG